MIYRISILFILLFIEVATAQQPFQKIYLANSPNNSLEGLSMLITSDSGYIMVGRYGVTSTDVVVIRTSSSGDTLWKRILGESNNDIAEYIDTTNDGGFIICGFTNSFGNGNEMLLIKLSSSGNIEWSRTYGGPGEENAICVLQTTDGGYLLGGTSTSNISGSGDDAAVLKLDSAGNMIWSKRFGRTVGLDQIRALREMPDGGFLLGGNSSVGNNWQIFLMRTDSFGDSLWAKTYSIYSLSLLSLELTDDGGFLLGGSVGNFSMPSGVLIKTDSLGVKLWSQYYRGATSPGFNGFNSVKRTSDGGFILTGITNSWGFGGEDVLIVKTDSVGVVQWSKVYGGTQDETGLDIFQTYDGGYVIHARRGTLSSSIIYLIKTDSLGNSNCNNASVPVQSFYLFSTEASPLWVNSSGWIETTQSLINYNLPIGVGTLCIGVGLQDVDDNLIGLTVSPNPFGSETLLKSSRPLLNASLIIIANTGQIISRKTNISGNEVLISRQNLPGGLYFVRVEEEGRIIKTLKLMITEE